MCVPSVESKFDDDEIFCNFLMLPDQCRTLHFTKPTIGKAFVGHVIRSQVTKESSCKVNCYMDKGCASLNIGPLQDGKLICQLSDSGHHFHPQDLISQVGYTYIATKQVQ